MISILRRHRSLFLVIKATSVAVLLNLIAVAMKWLLDVGDVLRLTIFLIAKYLLLAIVLIGNVTFLQWEAAWVKFFTASDNNVSLNVPFFCLVGVAVLYVEFLSRSLGTSLIL